MNEDEALSKRGKELFRELVRLYPIVEVDDYFKNGQWREAQMRIDLQLLLAHRSEAGAGEPCKLEDVVLPELPKEKPGLNVSMLKAIQPGLLNLSATSDLKEMALFVAKHKMEPPRAKLTLMALLPARRKYVIQKFETKATGGEANDEMEKFIKECAESKVWDVAGALIKTASQQSISIVKPTISAPVVAKPATTTIAPPKVGVKIGLVRPAAAAVVSSAVATGPQLVRPSLAGVKRPLSSIGIAPASKEPAAKRPCVATPAWGPIQGKAAMVAAPTRPAATVAAPARPAATVAVPARPAAVVAAPAKPAAPVAVPAKAVTVPAKAVASVAVLAKAVSVPAKAIIVPTRPGSPVSVRARMPASVAVPARVVAAAAGPRVVGPVGARPVVTVRPSSPGIVAPRMVLPQKW